MWLGASFLLASHATFRASICNSDDVRLDDPDVRLHPSCASPYLAPDGTRLLIILPLSFEIDLILAPPFLRYSILP